MGVCVLVFVLPKQDGGFAVASCFVHTNVWVSVFLSLFCDGMLCATACWTEERTDCFAYFVLARV